MPRSVPAPIATPALPAASGSVYLMLLPPRPCPVYLIKIVLKHAQCMPRSVPVPIPAPSGSVPPFPPPAVQFISSPLPPPCPVYLIIIVFKHAQCMPRSVPAPIAPPVLPAPSGSVHLMLLPPPPCPVYLIIIVLTPAQCMPRSVPAPIASPALPALPAPSGVVRV